MSARIWPDRFCTVCRGKINNNMRLGRDTCSLKCDLDKRKYEQQQSLEDDAANSYSLESFVKAGEHKKHAIFPDTHMPYTCWNVVEQGIKIVEIEQPDFVFQVGDLYDMFGQTRFPKSHFVDPEYEYALGREMAEEFWYKIRKAAPEAKCFQLKGNHDDRPAKRLYEKAVELKPFVDLKAPFEFEGVQTFHDSSKEIIVDGICYQHGFRSRSGDHMKFNLMPTVYGHTHTGNVAFQRVRDHLIWELNVGYMANPWDPALKYTPQKWTKWTWGMGLVDYRGPRFIPMEYQK